MVYREDFGKMNSFILEILQGLRDHPVWSGKRTSGLYGRDGRGAVWEKSASEGDSAACDRNLHLNASLCHAVFEHVAVWRGRLSTFDNDDHDEILWPGDDLVQCKPAKHDISSFLIKIISIKL